ncbi:uncharacterized protein LOC135136614 isoform X2 [Zophobas morio]|uniref:uncharacterized protein LOC135136614 isoform X2 n=1 Tax=Zophobas morio TaxID=2755281 RepID=UPI003082D6EC
MSPKASSDFGLYKERQKENNLRSLKFVVVATLAAIFLLIIYVSMHLITSSEPTLPLSSSSSSKAEKLVVAESVRREVFTPAKPFKTTYRGPTPSEFSSTTEKITTLNYPQVSSFRHRYYPNNIQDVIGYATRYHQPVRSYKHSSSQYLPQNKPSAKNFTDSDPFYLYKPQDPGEINLLATASFRFAPPIWSNLKPNRVHGPPQYDNIKRQETVNPPKPLSLTLNIFPNREKEEREQKFGLRQLIHHRIENLTPRLRLPESKTKKMVIHLNLYPNDVSVGESKVVNEMRRQSSPSPT